LFEALENFVQTLASPWSCCPDAVVAFWFWRGVAAEHIFSWTQRDDPAAMFASAGFTTGPPRQFSLEFHGLSDGLRFRVITRGHRDAVAMERSKHG